MSRATADEAQFLRRLDRLFPKTGGRVRMGRGDDGALLAPAGWCVTVDALVEGVHFFPSADPRLLGGKLLAINASDLNAMGTRAEIGFLSLALPANRRGARLGKFLAGLAAACRARGVILAGGNLSAARQFQAHLTLLGPAPEHPLRRDRARAGDALLLAGASGLAAAGLALERARLRGRALPAGVRDCLRALHAPAPPYGAGPRLGALAARGVRLSVLDVSDGPARDALRFSDRGRPLGARLDGDAFPIPPALKRSAAFLRRDARRFAVRGGEDYGLLIACAEQDAATVAAALAPCPVTLVGWLESSPGMRLTGLPRGVRGFDHFARGVP